MDVAERKAERKKGKGDVVVVVDNEASINSGVAIA